MSENCPEEPRIDITDIDNLDDQILDALSKKIKQRDAKLEEEQKLDRKYEQALQSLSKKLSIKEDFLDAAYKDDKSFLLDEFSLATGGGSQLVNILLTAVGAGLPFVLAGIFFLHPDSGTKEYAVGGFISLIGAMGGALSYRQIKADSENNKEAKEAIQRIHDRVNAYKP